MGDQDMQKHIVATYNSLRIGMFAVAALTPLIVVLWGEWFMVDWQDSISAYYFAPYGNEWKYSYYPGRTFFVGILFALGSALYIYKGFSKRENYALNTAGICAVLVAICPMYAETGYIRYSNYVHFTSAVVLFLCMAFAAVFCHEETLVWVEDEKRKDHYRRLYRIIGTLMLVFPAIGVVVAYVSFAPQRHIFWIEVAGIETFAAFWLVKTLELRESQADMRIAARQTRPHHSVSHAAQYDGSFSKRITPARFGSGLCRSRKLTHGLLTHAVPRLHAVPASCCTVCARQ